MGIPFYFHSITRQHANILRNTIPKCDHFYLDFNGAVHQSYRGALNEDEILERTWAYFEKLNKFVKPQQSVHICLDGVAPRAKMVQQRKRRYLSMLYAKMEGRKIEWDSNAISPGTPFMIRLNAFLKMKALEASKVRPTYVSPADEPGEGEHKIIQHLKSVPEGRSIVIYGMDADLIMLSLMTQRKQIYLLREFQPPKGRERNHLDPDYVVLDVDALREGILRRLDAKGKSETEAIESYCMMCFLLGNDFLPNIACMSFHNGDLERLVDLLRSYLQQMRPLVHTDKVTLHTDNMCQFLVDLAKDEDTGMTEMNKKYLMQRVHPSTEVEKVDLYPLLHENKHPLAQELYQLSSMAGWRSLYYKHLFHTRLHDTNVVRHSCREFLVGMEWTYRYYKQLNRYRHWYYPYSYAPTLRDLANALMGDGGQTHRKTMDELKETDFDHPHVQLLAILPFASVDLLPIKIKPYMYSVELGCSHLYPVVYPVMTYLKRHLWECSPILPKMEFELLEKCVK